MDEQVPAIGIQLRRDCSRRQRDHADQHGYGEVALQVQRETHEGRFDGVRRSEHEARHHEVGDGYIPHHQCRQSQRQDRPPEFGHFRTEPLGEQGDEQSETRAQQDLPCGQAVVQEQPDHQEQEAQ